MSRGLGSRRAIPVAATAVAAWLAGGILAWTAAATAPAAAATAPAAATHLSLVSQSNWVTPPQAGAPAPFTLKLSVTGAPAGTTVTASLYGKLGTRTGLESALRSSPARTDGPQVDRTAPVPLTDLPTGADGRVGLTIAVVPSAAAGPAPAPGTPALDLSCPVTVGGACTGVYPVVVSLASATGTGLATFTTFLTYAQSTSAERLRFAWVVPVAAPTSVRRTAAPAGQAVAPLAPGAASSLEGLVTDLQRAPSVPVTLDPEPATLQALAGTGSAGRAAVHTLAGMSAGQAGDETATGPYVRVDLGALAGAGEGTEIHAQMVEGAAVLAKLRVETGTDSTWVATGPVGASTGSGLSQVGAQRVVVPDNALARATVKSGATWTWPFDLPFGDRGPVLPAAAADGELADQFTAHPGDPALAAAQLLADLAMVHFELPYTATPRGMVAVPPPGWHPTAAFDRQLLAGLAGNPVVVPVTLSTFFATVPAHGARHLEGAGAGPSLPVSAARLLTAARQRVTAFDSAAPGATAVTTQLDQALLSSEAADLKSRARSAALSTFDRLLDRQLSLVKFSLDRSVTLTARTGWIPVTVVSDAPYTVDGTLSLSSAKFRFPGTTTQRLVLDHTTNPLRVHVVARTLGDSPVTAVLTSPEGGLVLARGQLTVRSTATSVIGLVLTAVALAVLLGWWARSWRSGRRRRAVRAGAAPPR